MNERLQTVMRLSRLVTSGLDVDRALTAIAEAVRDSFEAPGILFWTADEPARRLDLRLAMPTELASGFGKTTLTYDEGVAGWAARHRRVANVADVTADARPLTRQWFLERGFVSVLAVPVVVDDVLRGVLSILGRVPFDDEDTALAEGLAAHAAGVLHNAAVFARSEARRQAAEALAEVGRLLSQTLDPETVGRRVAESVCRLLDARSAIIYRITADGSFAAETMTSAAEFPWLVQLPADVGIAGLALRERRPVATSDLLADPRLHYTEAFKETVAQNPYRALLAAPLVAQGREFGVVAVGDRTGRPFTDDDMRLTQAFADQAAVALHNAGLYREASRQALRMRALADVERLLSETLDPELTTRRIVETLCALLESRASVLYRLDGGDFVVAAIAGDPGPTFQTGLRLPSGAGLVAVAVRDQQPAQSPNVLEDARVWLPPELRDRLAGASYRAALSAPLLINDRIMGALAVGDATGRVYDDDDVRLVQALADQAARALENARLYEESDRRRREAEELAQHNARLFADEQAARAAAQAAAQALRESEAVLQRAMEVGQIGSWTATLDGDGALEWSDEVFRIFGVARAEFRGVKEDFFERVHPEDLPAFAAARTEAVASGRPLRIDHRIVRPDGTIRWVHERADIQRDAQGRPVRFIGVVQDITDRKQAEEALQATEEQLRQSQKMDAIGRLAGGVAHDFNNLLSIITGRSELLIRRGEVSAPVRRDIELIHRTADRAAGLTRQLLAFSRKQVLQPKVLDLNAVVATMGRMLRRVIGEDVDLVIVARPGLARVSADPGQLEQVILNLAVNARDAMPGGGRLTIETADVALDAEHAKRHTGVRPGRHVMLAVSDTGVGMDATVRERIFEPFFTTKEIGRGTGLGLSTVYGIVQQSGGTIWVYSEPGSGTTFKIYLPAVDEAAHDTEVTPTPPRGGSETVLLCEDEPDLRELTREVLQEFGYRVIEASDGREALEVAADFAERIDLLLTDVVMPHMNGSELAARLARERGVRVLYMSGYTETVMVRGDAVAGSGFLQKPFSPLGLARAVREVLDGVVN